jgi:hypothetical protein
MAGHLLFNSGSNESSLARQFKWQDNTFKVKMLNVASQNVAMINRSIIQR